MPESVSPRPYVWHRTSCVYCGARTDEPPPLVITGWRRHPLACWRHISLLASDPVYAVPEEDEAVEAARERER